MGTDIIKCLLIHYLVVLETDFRFKKLDTSGNLVSFFIDTINSQYQSDAFDYNCSIQIYICARVCQKLSVSRKCISLNRIKIRRSFRKIVSEKSEKPKFNFRFLEAILVFLIFSREHVAAASTGVLNENTRRDFFPCLLRSINLKAIR